MSMNLAYLSIEYPPRIYGGLGVYVDTISRELALLGNKVSVFTLGDAQLSRKEIKGAITAFREIPLPMSDSLEIFFSAQTLGWGQGLKFLNDLLSYNQLAAARIVETGPYDLCVAHDWLGLPGGLVVRDALPLIYHVHGLEMGRSEHPNPQLVELEARGCRKADAVITVSQAMRGELVSQGVDPGKVHVCYHGVDSKVYSPTAVKKEVVEELRRRYGLTEEDRVILFLGRLEPVKGVIPLLQALPMVRERYPRAKLVLVGRGSLEDIVRDQARSLGGVVLVDEFLSPSQKAAHYALADVCVFPSLYEPFGIVGLEASAMQVASVVGANGTSGLREIVENPSASHPTGVHIDPQDPRDIAWGINTALEDPDQLKEWGKNARERVLKQFTWRKAAKQTLEIYKEVAASRS